ATVATIPRQNRCSITPPRKVVAARSMTRKRPSMLVLRRVEQPDVRCGGGPREALGGGRRGREGGDRDEAVALVDQRDVVANVPQLALLRGDHPLAREGQVAGHDVGVLALGEAGEHPPAGAV